MGLSGPLDMMNSRAQRRYAASDAIEQVNRDRFQLGFKLRLRRAAGAACRAKRRSVIGGA
jgi:hypothetical protein